MIKRMLKVQMIGPKPILDDAIKALHAAAVVHIETMPEEELRKGDFLKKLPIESEKLKNKEALEKSLERLKALKSILPAPPGVRPERVSGGQIQRYLSDLAPIEERARFLRARKEALAEELSTAGRYEKLLRGFAPIVSRLGGLKNFEVVGLTLEKTREDIPGLLEAEVSRITEDSYQIFTREIEDGTLGVVLTYPKHFALEIKSLLTGRAISEVRLPDEYEDMTLIEALKVMGRRRAELPGLMHEIDRDLAAISAQWYGTIEGALRAVGNSLDEFGALSYAAATRFAFIIEGWVPAGRYSELKEKFSGLFGEKVLLRTLEINEHDREAVPVFIKNPSFIRPFEVFLAALSPPKYGSIDPTPFVAIFFPAFFGLIVADVGYGAIIFVLALFLRFRLREGGISKDIATVLAISAISAMVFGFLFGEMFGDLGERLGLLHPILLNRIESIKTLMYLTLGIGVGHVLLGITLSVASRLMRRDYKEALARACYLVLVVTLLSILAVLSGYASKGLLVYLAAILAVSFIAFVALEGMLGPIEFIEALGHIVSYVRIMAVGTASVVMALVANRIGGLSESLVAGVALAAVIHALNLVLSILSPSIQSMRLQYVEFFSKFYEGGGRRYRPFKSR